MDECQNVIDFEELEKLCSSEFGFESQQNLNPQQGDISATKTENNNNNNINTGAIHKVRRRETKEIEVQTEACDEKDFDNNFGDVAPFEQDHTGIIDNMGQTESKRSTKVKGPETKGTAMSFGFKKKSLPVYTGATKKIPLKTEMTNDDANGNGSMDSVHDNSASSGNNNTNRTRLKPPTKTKDTTASNVRSNRFGFRNTIRPASVGLQPKHTDVFSGDDDDAAALEEKHNNNSSHSTDAVAASCVKTPSVKKRSKSAAATTRNTVVSFNETVMVQPVPVERRKSSLKDTNPPGSLTAKYTLHSTSLPKPQQPIPIQVKPAMDTKDFKHAMNLSRRQFFGLSDSSDSGVVSDDSRRSSKVVPGTRYVGARNLEMIRNGRHTFEVRDLENLTPVVPLALPRLPSVFKSNQQAPIGDLLRPDNRSEVRQQSSLESLATTESTEEEKLQKDNNNSEKSMLFTKTLLREHSTSSKNSSPGSSRHSWCNAGESMAVKDCSSISSDSDVVGGGGGVRRNNVLNEAFVRGNSSIDEESEDLTSLTGTAPTTNSISGLSLELKHSTIYIQDSNREAERETTKEEAKFAEIAATLDNANLLYDETSPTDSMASSSSESENAKKQKIQKTLAECLAEKDQKDLEDISPELEAVSPLSPGTPTHASNSLSLSDVGRDFLIDDEIADQPALLFNDDQPSQAHGGASEGITDTPTLRDSVHSSVRSLQKTPVRKIMTTYESPASVRRPKMNLSRTGSLDTLSPCESIASDDLMVDFDTRSSMDSIELQNMQSHNSSGVSARSSTDGLLNWQEMEQKTGDMIKDWNKLIRANRHSSRESITSQLPARTTRLLNRRLQNNSSQSPSHNGSDSPRSIDSFPNRRTPSKPSPLLQRSTEDIDLIDKAMKNSLLQEVSCVKKELLRLRRVLQESDTLNPFDTNGQMNPAVLDENRRIDELSQESGLLTLKEDQRAELADLRRQVVFLQSQIDDRDRTIRIQANTITKYESHPAPNPNSLMNSASSNATTNTSGMGTSVEMVSTATQTERLRPISMGPDSHGSSLSSRSELPVPVLKVTKPSNIPQHQQQHTVVIQQQQQSPAFLKQTQVSSIYTKLSSIKPTTTLNAANRQMLTQTSQSPHKTVRTTQIGNVMPSKTAVNAANSKIYMNGMGKLLANHKSSPELRMNGLSRVNGVSNGK
ncbi:uncharacterized protein LOC134832758 isoform X2 [Culicoides brevitarsis]|uniref:uncharacterized protein LOC134832758 isoform X2 n=1 Tax=Culicoides brevitarsis TaxID=469753 RepID=UPI00307B46AB